MNEVIIWGIVYFSPLATVFWILFLIGFMVCETKLRYLIFRIIPMSLAVLLSLPYIIKAESWYRVNHSELVRFQKSIYSYFGSAPNCLGQSDNWVYTRSTPCSKR